MLVRWPNEAEQRTRLAERQIPRLLLVDDGIPIAPLPLPVTPPNQVN